LYGWSGTASLLSRRRATRLQALDDRRADLGPAVAAITKQEHSDVAKLVQVGAIDD
jgi:hypothetical protein